MLERLRRRVGAPDAIGLSGQMHGLVALDGADRVLRPALLWNDQRTGGRGGRRSRRGSAVSAGTVAATGNRMLTGFTAPKLAWMAAHEPELYRAGAASVLLPKDYVRLRLCGERATDVTDASGTGWFDVAARTWSAIGAATRWSVDPAWLPVALESARGLGPDARTGSRSPPAPAIRAPARSASARWPAGGPASVVLGTSGVVCAPVGGSPPTPQGRLQASCHVSAGGWFLMGVMLSAAGSLAWLHEVLGGASRRPGSLRGGWEPAGGRRADVPAVPERRAGAAPRPGRARRVRRASRRHDRGALARAVLEGVAFGLRDCLDLVRAAGVDVTVARVSGGGARSGVWLEILAAVLGTPLEVVEAPEGRPTARHCSGGSPPASGSRREAAAAACVRPIGVVEPRPEWVARVRRAPRALPGAVPGAARLAGRGLRCASSVTFGRIRRYGP